MYLVSAPVGSLAIAAFAVAALVSWLCRDRRHPGPRLVGRTPLIDWAALNAAESEVRSRKRSSGQTMIFNPSRMSRERSCKFMS